MKKAFITNPQLFFNGIIIALTIIILDLYLKKLIFEILDNKPGQIIVMTNFLNMVKVYNTGVSFGMLSNLSNGIVILSIMTISITIIFIIWLTRINSKHMSIALGFIIGGAVGNITDRIMNGAVADFIDFHVMGYHWPAFNLADSVITIGAIILIFDEFVLSKKNHSTTSKENDN